MHLTTQEIPVQNLEIGMYVSRLDVPWVQTPFPIQGFKISKQEELDLLSHFCNKVYVDHFLSTVEVKSRLQLTPKAGEKKTAEIDPKLARLMNEKARFKPRVEEYLISSKLKKEVKAATQMYDQVMVQMSAIYRNMEQDGYLNVSEVRKASAEMVKSIIKNPNALAWLCRISIDDETLHQQAIRSAVWGLIFARHLGLSRHDLRDIGTALLLAPIGKCKIAKELLYSQQTQEEVLAYQQHVEYTLEETNKIFSSSHQVNYILSAYCERNNGSGFPRNLVGNRIPFLARVAGIADYYEQLINPYPGADALTPAEAISHLYNARGTLFQRELVEEFIQSMGIYPTGSLVKLSNNAVAIVIEQPEKSRLRPRVAVLKNSMNVTLEKPKLVNLADEPTDEFAMPLQIDRSLKSTSTDIDAADLHDKLFGGKNWLSFLNS
jgi:HD-GYP domain-containing protein (c-di-GMP phosphodiesterase class II)